MLIKEDNLRAVVRAICTAAGSTGDEPAMVADNLVDANLTGHDSHGVGMLPRYISCVLSGELSPNQHVEILKDEGTTLMLDGKQGYGQVIGREAMELGIERARKNGVCVMTVRNSFHLCRIGAWAEQCAAAGMVSMHYVNVLGKRPLVAPYGGGDARYGTNPYTCVLPATNDNPPVLLDMATSLIAVGKVRVARNKGEQVREGALIDSHGRPTTDPNAMYTQPYGAVLPFGDHKGYGMALMSEMLAGVLSGGDTMRRDTAREKDTALNNMLTIIFDPQRFVDGGRYKTEMDATITDVRASPPQDPSQPVLMPGDPERTNRAERGANGIPIDAATWEELLSAAESVGLDRAKVEAMAG
ncbi:MAG: malate/lactate/ureidoglycolate dehydrogenase [Pseudomonadota bacterium]